MLGNDRTPARPPLEASDVSLDTVEPGRGGGRIVASDVGVDRGDVALRRPRDVNAIFSWHGGGL